MNLMLQIVEDYRLIEEEHDKLVEENARLRRELSQLEETARIRSASQFDQLRLERDRLKLENRQLDESVQLWRRRHDDLARE